MERRQEIPTFGRRREERSKASERKAPGRQEVNMEVGRENESINDP